MNKCKISEVRMSICAQTIDLGMFVARSKVFGLKPFFLRNFSMKFEDRVAPSSETS